MKNLASLYPNLLLKIEHLNTSEEFKLMAKLNGFVTLEDIVNSDLDKLPTRAGSGMNMLKEAMTVLREFGLGELAED
jgi:hypothetical protein